MLGIGVSTTDVSNNIVRIEPDRFGSSAFEHSTIHERRAMNAVVATM